MTLRKGAAYTLALAALGIQLVRPARTNPPSDRSRSVFARTHVPPAAASVLERACGDCHSNDTRWPWYSHVAPVSWFVIDHVDHGRSHFNYSDWTKYDGTEAERLIKNSCDLARKGEMPLPLYVRMHSDTQLTPQDVGALCNWAGN